MTTKTYLPKKEDIKRKTYLVDAKDKILGRLATKIAVILRGKDKPIFTPHMDVGDCVVVINASQIRVSGRKLKEKLYSSYSGYPGGLKQTPLEEMLKKRPDGVIRLAVKRMLPKSPLGRKMLKKLNVYAGAEHPHKAQKPQNLET